jgi:tagatose 6-phosphate kinase
VKRPVVVALNPAIDVEWRVDDVRWEEKNTIRSERRWAGGKGVNVARWLRHFGEDPILILPLGGDAGRELATHLKDEKVEARITAIRQTTRANIVVSTRRQGQLRFNPQGPELSQAEWRRVLSSVCAALPSASCLILSGSLPRGIPVSAYAEMIRSAQGSGIPVFLDCDGPALADAVRAGPFLVKPNEHELVAWADRMRTQRSVRSAALTMSKLTGGWVFVSRGGKPALLVNAATGVGISRAPRRLKPRNTVGAGDALLAAVAVQIVHSRPPAAWLRAGLAAGSAAVRLEPGRVK